MLAVEAIPAFSDNYIWLLHANGNAIVVDPGAAEPVLRVLQQLGLQLRGILVTHHHPDHTGGIAELLQHAVVPVYGPAGEMQRIPWIDHPLVDGDTLHFASPAIDFKVMAVPGHTLGHIAYFASAQAGADPVLFCGDTLFVYGCGRLFEGSPEQMFESLQRLAALPELTRVYCAHEYTLGNLRYAQAADPGNAAIGAELARVLELREQGLPTVPGTIAKELAMNPFIRSATDALIRSAAEHSGHAIQGGAEALAVLRQWKDTFRTPTP